MGLRRRSRRDREAARRRQAVQRAMRSVDSKAVRDEMLSALGL